MIFRARPVGAFGAALVAATLVPTLGAQATSALRVTSAVNTTITSAMPIVRIHFSTPETARAMPKLSVRPALATTWQQIGPRDVQAVVTGKLRPLVSYTIDAPTAVRCATRCTFTRLRTVSASVAANVTWEEQLLATLHYLPLTFTPTSPASDPAAQVSGTFSWSYTNLPLRLSSLWRQGASNVLVTGALMHFQSNLHLATTGVADTTTWDALLTAVEQGQVDPSPYSYVEVSETLPQTLILYVADKKTFHALVNTGISVAPTVVGTYPVYLRYVTQTMSGTNPDGSHYSDPGIPWVSYFNGGDALHGFIRSTYGWPQSLGCVEMPFNDAKAIWPYTSIGTLVTVR
jgi:hypothetical protein